MKSKPKPTNKKTKQSTQAKKASPPSRPKKPVQKLNSKSPKASGGVNDIGKVKTAPVGSGKAALVKTPAKVTWKSVTTFDSARIKEMKPDELAVEINGRLSLINEVAPAINGWKICYVRVAIQTGLFCLQGKEKVPHGAFDKWCAENCPDLPERTRQRYMLAAKATALSDLKDDTKLQDLYSKLPLPGGEVPTAKKKEKPDLTVKPSFTPADFVARLKSSREFLNQCVNDLPYESLDAPLLDELSAEIAAWSAVLDDVKGKVTAARELKSVNAVEVPANDENGVPPQAEANSRLLTQSDIAA